MCDLGVQFPKVHTLLMVSFKTLCLYLFSHYFQWKRESFTSQISLSPFLSSKQNLLPPFWLQSPILQLTHSQLCISLISAFAFITWQGPLLPLSPAKIWHKFSHPSLYFNSWYPQSSSLLILLKHHENWFWSHCESDQIRLAFNKKLF